jgi:hypothetical protein
VNGAPNRIEPHDTPAYKTQMITELYLGKVVERTTNVAIAARMK